MSYVLQDQTANNTPNDFDAGVKYAYVFTASASYTPTLVNAMIFNNKGSSLGTGTMSVYHYTSGNPDSGTLLGFSSIDISGISSSNTTTTEVSFPIVLSTAITSGQQYALVISATNSSGGSDIGWRQWDNAGATGSWTYNGSTWSARGSGQLSIMQVYSGGTGTIEIESKDTSFTSSAASSSSQTRSITLGTGLNLYLLLFIQVDIYLTGTDISTVTWNGTSMTRLAAVGPISSQHANYIYGLANPDTGTHNYVITANGTTQFGITSAYVNLVGANQTGQPDNSNTASGTGSATSLSVSLTTIANNTAAFIFTGCGTTSSAGSNENVLILDSGNGRVLAASLTFPLTPSGSYTMASNFTTNGGNVFTGTAVSIAPIASALPNSNFFMFMK